MNPLCKASSYALVVRTDQHPRKELLVNTAFTAGLKNTNSGSEKKKKFSVDAAMASIISQLESISSLKKST